MLPIKKICVVGAGGNGSIFLTHLCRIHQAWVALGGTPFTIRLYDPDVVTEANLARQVFCEADVGQHKAAVLAQRIRGFFGIDIEYETRSFGGRHPYMEAPDVVVGCVDSIKARKLLAESCKKSQYTRRQWGEESEHTMEGCYWLDLGNTDAVGQVVLGGHGLPTLFDVLPQMRSQRDRKNAPSCSMAESLDRQDLFINSTIATLGAQLLWHLMRKGGLNHHGFFINLRSGRVSPINL